VVTLYDRLGASLRRAPYVWLVATILLLLLLIEPLATIARPNGSANLALTVLGMVVVAYAVVFSEIVVPRLFERRRLLNETRVAILRWSAAAYPFLFGYAIVAAGAHQSVAGLGQLASVILLVRAARRIRRAHRPEDA
jgi:uncharacterized membrane protein